MKSSWEFQPRVDKGCKLLDERLGPEWVEKIDLEILNLEFGCACVLGQLCIDIVGGGHTYGLAAQALFPNRAFVDNDAAEEHGFILQDTPHDYPALTECWTRTIARRRAES